MRRFATLAGALALALSICSGGGRAVAQPRTEPVVAEDPDWTGLGQWVQAARSAQLDVRTATLELERLSPRAGVALIAPEHAPPTEDLLRFVREGGRLLVADEGATTRELFAALGLRTRVAPTTGETTLPGHPAFIVLEPRAEGLFAGIPRLVTNHPAAFETLLPPAPAASVEFADGTPFALELALGNGAVLALADSSLFINLMQTVPENALLAANAMAWLAENGARPVFVVAGVGETSGAYSGVAPPDDQLAPAAAFNRVVGKLSAARPDSAAVRFFVALILAAACIYALAVFPGATGRARAAGPVFPRVSTPTEPSSGSVPPKLKGPRA